MILVTGGTGLVGSHLLFQLTAKKQKIRAIYRHEDSLEKTRKVFAYYANKEEVEIRLKIIEWIKADITDIPALEKAFKDVSEVYHCAALVSFDPADIAQLRKINIEGTANIANLCIAYNIKKLCYISSVAAVGKSLNKKPITEEIAWNPENNHTDYAISKYGAEIEVWRASQEGVPVVIVNPGIIIGPGFWGSGSGLIFSRIHHGMPFYFEKITGFVGVNDVANAALKLMNTSIKNEKYILVAENLSFKTVLHQSATALNKKKPKYKLKKWMLWWGWVFQKMGSFLGLKRSLALATVKSFNENTQFSSEKIENQLDFEFTPIEKVISETGEIFKSEFKEP